MLKMGKLFLSLLMTLSLAACAGTTAQTTTARSMLMLHDSIKTGATAANALCVQSVIAPGPCMKIKGAYDKFRLAWPLANDALVLYLQSGSQDTQANFTAAYSVFMADYQDIFSMLLQYGVIKQAEGVK